jgi:dopamine beta-monooxygenase
MVGADIVLFYAKDESYTFEERYASSESTPQIRETKSTKFIYGMQTNNQTSFIFQRNLVASCPDTQSDIITDGTGQWVIYAKGLSNSFSQHSPMDRGNAFIDFSSATELSPILPLESKNISIGPSSFSIPSNFSTYYCYSHYVLPSDQEYHLIHYEPIFHADSLVHHMIIYTCPIDLSDQFQRIKCVTDLSQPQPGRDVCQVQWVIAAPGTKPRTLPLNMGKLWSKYVLLEIHYNNPRLLENVLDSSRFLLTYTHILRPISIGVLALGIIQFKIYRSSVVNEYFSCTRK